MPLQYGRIRVRTFLPKGYQLISPLVQTNDDSHATSPPYLAIGHLRIRNSRVCHPPCLSFRFPCLFQKMGGFPTTFPFLFVPKLSSCPVHLARRFTSRDDEPRSSANTHGILHPWFRAVGLRVTRVCASHSRGCMRSMAFDPCLVVDHV